MAAKSTTTSESTPKSTRKKAAKKTTKKKTAKATKKKTAKRTRKKAAKSSETTASKSASPSSEVQDSQEQAMPKKSQKSKSQSRELDPVLLDADWGGDDDSSKGKQETSRRKAKPVEIPPLHDHQSVAAVPEEKPKDDRTRLRQRREKVKEKKNQETEAKSTDSDNSQNEERQSQDGNKSGRRRRRRRSGGRNNDNNQNNQGGQNNSNRNNRGNRDRNRSGGNNQQNRGKSPRKAYTGEEITGMYEGVLELHPKRYGFLRDPSKNYMSQESDPFVSSSIVEKYNLREGILIKGDVGSGSRGQGPRLKSIETIDGRTIEEFQKIRHFDDLTPINPFEQIRLETGATPLTMRVMDLLTPIGKGQRALIVAPPRSGKTMLLQDIADSVSENHPEVHLIVLLIDERPEEVTEMQRRVKGEVIASSMDREVESHVRISQLIFERAKRIAEAGGDVFVLLDSITRTARAFNKWIGNTGRTMSGGLDVKAMDIPKKMFGTARLFDEGGSLTVAGTALIETGSRMDDVIFQEFKGTGNMELVLSRSLADRRIWPAIDIAQSGTRREEKILSPETLDGVTMLRRSLISMSPVEAMEQLTQTLRKFPTNQEFLERIRSIL